MDRPTFGGTLLLRRPQQFTLGSLLTHAFPLLGVHLNVLETQASHWA